MSRVPSGAKYHSVGYALPVFPAPAQDQALPSGRHHPPSCFAFSPPVIVTLRSLSGLSDEAIAVMEWHLLLPAVLQILDPSSGPAQSQVTDMSSPCITDTEKDALTSLHLVLFGAHV